MTIPHLAPFEERVLHLIGDVLQCEASPGSMHLTAMSIHTCGMVLWGPEWAGARRISLRGLDTFPTLNAALGRLQKKGLLERQANDQAAACNEYWGEWHLTPMGRDVLGLPPLT